MATKNDQHEFSDFLKNFSGIFDLALRAVIDSVVHHKFFDMSKALLGVAQLK